VGGTHLLSPLHRLLHQVSIYDFVEYMWITDRLIEVASIPLETGSSSQVIVGPKKTRVLTQRERRCSAPDSSRSQNEIGEDGSRQRKIPGRRIAGPSSAPYTRPQHPNRAPDNRRAPLRDFSGKFITTPCALKKLPPVHESDSEKEKEDGILRKRSMEDVIAKVIDSDDDGEPFPLYPESRF
jgi:hypothetical protein